ncbi:hypothetical protein AB832_06655 [Flavobacteriaceae bacterium (ex Bugula neritina AB1)]|nr:hypothetical protein AB832_06655 [Flavobacteriaceae bacterium (ex Bugula neritina AB1)]
MKHLKSIVTKISMVGILAIFTQCATSQKVDKAAPVSFKSPYFQKWVAGVQGGGSGFNVYLPLSSETDIELNEIYFRGKKVELLLRSDKPVYVGRYTDPNSVKRDKIMSSDPKEEFKNQVPVIEEKIPFELKGNECIIGYTKEGKKGYFKLDTLKEKEILAYPSAPRQ